MSGLWNVNTGLVLDQANVDTLQILCTFLNSGDEASKGMYRFQFPFIQTVRISLQDTTATCVEFPLCGCCLLNRFDHPSQIVTIDLSQVILNDLTTWTKRQCLLQL